jgi:CMP-N,N'-diacetyllegionaminic acid synthase
VDVLGLIPARGGSKGIPRKNLVPVAGRPLLAWTIDAARASEVLTRTVVSTEDDEIAQVASEHGVEVLDRPEALSADETPMAEVVRHAVSELGPSDVLVLLQPTSPLRRGDHIDAAVRILLDSGADAVVSVVEVPHQFRPQSLMDVVDGRLVRRGAETSRHEKEVVYARNGPAVLVRRGDRLDDDLYAGDCRPYVMSARESIDVDGPDDLALAQLLLR